MTNPAVPWEATRVRTDDATGRLAGMLANVRAMGDLAMRRRDASGRGHRPPGDRDRYGCTDSTEALMRPS